MPNVIVAFDGGNAIASLEDTNDIGLRACQVRDSPNPEGIYLRLALGGITGHKDFARDTGVVFSLDEWLPALHQILMVFLENGHRGQRGKARLKYLLDDWGFEKFLKAVGERLPFPLRRVDLAQCRFAPETDRAAHLGQHPQKQEGFFWVGVHVPVGKISFSPDKLIENATVLITSVIKAKPSVAKGKYIKGCTLSSTMGPGILLDTSPIETAAKA